MKKTLRILILFISASLVTLNSATGITIGNSDTLYPPVNFRIDSLRALVTWDYPSITLLDENFESDTTLPERWITSSAENSAWYITSNAISLNFYIGPHTRYAATNDFNAGQQNDGCCDYLVAPAVDLTLTDSAVLTFAARYTGVFNQAGYIELSVDNGVSWLVIDTMEPMMPSYYELWDQITIDLSRFAGSGGCSSAIVRFHADDNGQQASGWAVDDLKIMAYVTTLEYYYLWLNDVVLAIVDTNSYQIDPESLEFGQQYKIEIAAIYTTGISPLDSVIFTNRYLPYPENVEAMPANNDACLVYWNRPQFGNTGMELYLSYYLVYCNDSIIDMKMPTDTVTYHSGLEQGTYCYSVSAVYDMEPIGYTDEQESFKNTTCADLYYGCCLPILEEWWMGFDYYLWENEQNWIIDNSNGLIAPCARFNGDPVLEDYESALVLMSEQFYMETATPCNLIWGFDLALDDSLANGNESLELLYNINYGEWHAINTFTNQGDMGWSHFSYALYIAEPSGMIKIKFLAKGDQSNAIKGWLVDNVSLSYKCFLYPVYNLTATPSNADPFTINLEWNSPVDSLNLKNTSATEDLMEYHIYRRALYPHQSTWEDIAETTKTWYSDDSLASNCYDYYVKAFYSEGSSAISNIDSLNCIDVGIAQAESTDFRVYPNPATHMLQWETDKPVKEIMLYNSFGRMVYKKSTDNRFEGKIDISGLSGGLYLVSFVCSDGQRITNKVTVFHE